MKKTLYIVGAMLVMASCTKETVDTQSLKATFTSSIEQTRVVGTEWETGDQIGIIVVSTTVNAVSEGYRFNNCHNVTFTDPSQGIFIPDTDLDQIYYSVDENEYVEFYAYYPYSSSLTADTEEYSMDITDQTEPRKIDFMESSTNNDGNGGYNKNSSTVALGFLRNMAKISLALQAGDGLELSDISAITLEGFYTSATYDLATNSFKDLGGGELSITPYSAGNDIYSAILFPENAASHMVYFTTPYGDVPLDLSGYNLTKGEHLYFTVTVSQTAASYEQSEINGWDDAYVNNNSLETE